MTPLTPIGARPALCFRYALRIDVETRASTAHPARLGPAQIVNWNRTNRKLTGRIDEMLVLGRAMIETEIRALFEAGNPYR